MKLGEHLKIEIGEVYLKDKFYAVKKGKYFLSIFNRSTTSKRLRMAHISLPEYKQKVIKF